MFYGIFVWKALTGSKHFQLCFHFCLCLWICWKDNTIPFASLQICQISQNRHLIKHHFLSSEYSYLPTEYNSRDKGLLYSICAHEYNGQIKSFFSMFEKVFSPLHIALYLPEVSFKFKYLVIPGIWKYMDVGPTCMLLNQLLIFYEFFDLFCWKHSLMKLPDCENLFQFM